MYSGSAVKRGSAIFLSAETARDLGPRLEKFFSKSSGSCRKLREILINSRKEFQWFIDTFNYKERKEKKV